MNMKRMWMWLAAAALVLAIPTFPASAGYLRAYALFDEAGNDLQDMFRAYTGATSARIDLHGAAGTYRVRMQPTTLTANRTLTLPNADLDLANVLELSDTYQGANQTGNGSEQSHAHGLDRTPGQYWIELLGGHNGAGAAGTQACSITYGAVNSTAIPVTVTSGCVYRVHAF